MAIVRKLENAFWERRLGIATRGLHTSKITDNEHIFYGTTSYSMTRRVLESLSLRAEDVFVDLGSGKGRVVCIASLSQLKEVVGVDDDAKMCAVARANSARMKGRRAPITIVQTRAQDFDYGNGTVFYMFDPFGPKTMEEVLGEMKAGLDRKPRTIRIVYVMPAQDVVLRRTEWLSQYDRWTTGTHPFVEHPISFWTNGRT